MFSLVPEEIEDYCEEHTSEESELLYKLNRETNLKVLRPRMLSGKLQGAFLSMISKMIAPTHILELGTYTGYSALCLAEGLTVLGSLHTIEIDEELEEGIRNTFQQSVFSKQLFLHIGDALNIIPTLNYEWDLVFIDAEKKDYFQYYQLVMPHVRKGGFLLVDNVLWSGKVIEDVPDKDKDTHAILDFNNWVHQDKNVKNLILPFRDGMMLIQKI